MTLFRDNINPPQQCQGIRDTDSSLNPQGINIASLPYPIIPPAPSPTPASWNPAIPASRVPQPTPYPLYANGGPSFGQNLRGIDVDGNCQPLNFKIFGPSPQTLFLGCSIAGFNVSLGWGQQPSQLTVTLVEDKCNHYVASDFSGDVNLPNNLLESAIEVKDTDDHYYNEIKPSGTETPQDYFTRNQKFIDKNGNIIVPGKIYYKYVDGKYVSRYWHGPDPGFLGDINHFRYGTNSRQGIDPLDTRADSFVDYGEPVDILGCPVYFKYDDFTYCGIIKNWVGSNSAGGKQYTVNIEGINDLLSNTQLILDHYPGSIFTNISGSPVVTPIYDSIFKDEPSTILLSRSEKDFEEGKNKTIERLRSANLDRIYRGISLDRLFPNSKDETRPSGVSGPVNLGTYYSAQDLTEAHKGNIAEDGNLPNIINIYGYLEANGKGNFGGANRTSDGLPYSLVKQTLIYLTHAPIQEMSYTVGGPTDNPSDFNIFSPFGGIIGRTPQSITPSLGFELAIPQTTNKYVIFKRGDSPKAYDNKGGITNCNIRTRPGTWDNINLVGGSVQPEDSCPTPTPTIGGDTTVEIFDMGLIPPDDPDELPNFPTNRHKQLYFLDLSDLPELPDSYKINYGLVIDLSRFVNQVCEESGYDYFWELIYANQGSIQGGNTIPDINFPSWKVIKLRTVSRKVQPPDSSVRTFMQYARNAGLPVTDISLGKEFDAGANTRTMYIGGHQRRLFQAKNFRIARVQSSYVYSPVLKTMVSIETKEFNQYRLPDENSLRDPWALSVKLSNTNVNEVDRGAIDDKQKYYTKDENWAKLEITRPTSNQSIPWLRPSLQRSTATIEGHEPNVGNYVIANKVSPQEEATQNSGTPSFGGGGRVSQPNWVRTVGWVVNATAAFVTNIFNSNCSTSPPVGSQGGTTGGSGDVSQLSPKEKLQKFVNNASAQASAAWAKATNTANRFQLDQTTGKMQSPTYQQHGILLGNDFGDANRFFPASYDSICPYFGAIEYLDEDLPFENPQRLKTPRPVFYDTWTNQYVIQFNVKELPTTRLSGQLQGLYLSPAEQAEFNQTPEDQRDTKYPEGEPPATLFFVTESEIRAAMAGTDNWIKYLSFKLYRPDIVLMIKKVLCPNTDTDFKSVVYEYPAETTPPTNEKGTPGPGVGNTQGSVTDAGNSVPDASINREQQGNMQNIDDKYFNACDIFKSSLGFTPRNKKGGSGGAQLINAGFRGAFDDDLRMLAEFFAEIGRNYYGRKYMVRLPQIMSYQDKQLYTAEVYDEDGIPKISRGITVGNGFKVTEGKGKIYKNWDISSEGAWEETGNYIDDSLIIGGWRSSIFRDESSNLIQPILGYLADDRYDWDAWYVCLATKKKWENLSANPNEAPDISTTLGFFDALHLASQFRGTRNYSDAR